MPSTTSPATATRIAQARVRAAKHLAASVVGIAVLTQPAAAQSFDPNECGAAVQAFDDLFQLLTELQRLGVGLGLFLGLAGYTLSGIFYMLPGTENDLRAKKIFVNTTIGLLIVLMSEAFIEFIIQVMCG